MTTMYLIRHAQCDGNLYRQYDGWYDTPLTKLGRQQAAKVGERFQDVPIDAIYASDEQRAIQTAEAIATRKGLTVSTRSDLRETNYGLWEHMQWADIAATWPGQLEEFSKGVEGWMVLGADPTDVSAERIVNALWDIARKNEGRTVAVVSHGDILRLGLGRLHGWALNELGAKSPMSTNAAVSKLEFDGDEVRFIYEHDWSHLPPELVTQRSPYASRGLRYRFLAMEEAFPIEGLEDFSVDRTEGIWIGGWYKDTPASLVQLCHTAYGQPAKIGFYYIAPEMRGHQLGIQPMGQVIDLCRRLHLDSVRLYCPEEEKHPFFSKWDNFEPVGGGWWERAIPPIPELR